MDIYGGTSGSKIRINATYNGRTYYYAANNAYTTYHGFFFGTSEYHNICRDGVGINTQGYYPAINSVLDVVSTTKGLLPPRMTTAQRTTLGGLLTTANDVKNGGMIVYDTNDEAFYYWKHSTLAWVAY
jgi:hypothetical protein